MGKKRLAQLGCIRRKRYNPPNSIPLPLPPPPLKSDETPLHSASYHGHARIVALLLAAPGVHPLATKVRDAAKGSWGSVCSCCMDLPSVAVWRDSSRLGTEIWESCRSHIAEFGPARRRGTQSSQGAPRLSHTSDLEQWSCCDRFAFLHPVNTQPSNLLGGFVPSQRVKVWQRQRAGPSVLIGIADCANQSGTASGSGNNFKFTRCRLASAANASANCT